MFATFLASVVAVTAVLVWAVSSPSDKVPSTHITCPHEESCIPDYRNGEWIIIPIVP